MERTLDDQVRPEDTHGGNTNTGLCGTVGGTEAGEDDGGHASHRSKERLLFSQHLSHFNRYFSAAALLSNSCPVSWHCVGGP